MRNAKDPRIGNAPFRDCLTICSFFISNVTIFPRLDTLHSSRKWASDIHSLCLELLLLCIVKLLSSQPDFDIWYFFWIFTFSEDSQSRYFTIFWKNSCIGKTSISHFAIFDAYLSRHSALHLRKTSAFVNVEGSSYLYVQEEIYEVMTSWIAVWVK